VPTKTIIEAVRDGIREEMARDDSVVIMGEDVGFKGGVFKATVGLLDEFGAERVVDTPLAESGIVGTAIGAALNGLRPIAEIQFADFIHPAMDQIINEAAKIRYRSNGDFGCPLVVRAPFGGGIHGGLYHSQSVEAFFAHVPGLKVVIPGNPYDAKGLLKSAIRDPDPVLFFEHKRTYRLFRQEVPDEDYTVPLGKARVAREGDDLTVIAYGLMLHYSLQAAEELAQEGVDVEVVDLRTLVPLDTATILDSVKKTNKVLIVHEDTRTGGFGGELAAIIAEEAFEDLDGPVRRLTGPDVPAMPFNTVLEHEFMPNPERIAQAMRDLAAY
jgi:2-oxoisovalerate dehydrogenase E1 component beta subunit